MLPTLASISWAAFINGSTNDVRLGFGWLRLAGLIRSEFLGVCISTLGVLDSAYLRAPLGKTCGATLGSGSLTLCILGGSRCLSMD